MPLEEQARRHDVDLILIVRLAEKPELQTILQMLGMLLLHHSSLPAFGWVWTILGILAFGSMMRNPLRYLLAKMRGDAPELPKELRE